MRHPRWRRWFTAVAAACLPATLVGVVRTADAAAADDPVTALVTGVVFADRDGDGVQGSGEPGLGGVMVSDGAAVTRTGVDGRYELAVDTQRRLTDIVFVSAPAGYVPATDEERIPRFFVRLQPDGQDTARADFPLRPDPAARRPDFRFAGLADVHVQAGTANTRQRFGGQIRQVNELLDSYGQDAPPAFIVVSGDLTNTAAPAEFADFRAGAAESRLPVWPAVGNHEYNVQAGNTYGDLIENYRRFVGPEWYSFTYGDKHFVVLDNIQGLRQEEQYRWLEQDLALNAVDRQVVVITHVPMNTPQSTDVAQIPRYVALLESYDTKLLLAGHTHSNDVDGTVIAGALHASTTSSAYTIDQTPNGFRLVRFKDGQVTLPFRQYDAPRRVTLVNPADGSTVARGRTTVEVNAYQTTSEVVGARYRVDGQDWQDLAASGDWTWAATADTSALPLGEHRVEVETVQRDGHRERRSAAFTLAGSVAVPQEGTAWPTFHGDSAHSGQRPDTLEPPLGLAWTHLTGGKILTGSPAVALGQAFVGVRDDSGTGQYSVLAVDLATGAQRFRVRTDANVEGTPTVVGDTVYATSIRGTVYALDAHTGQTRWTRRVGNAGDRVWAYQSPTVSGGLLYQAYATGASTALDVVNATTGALRWRRTGLGPNWHSFGTAAVGGGRVYVTAQGGRISAFDAATGAVRWNRTPAGGWMRSAPVLAGDLLLQSYQGDLVVALDAATGAERWRYRSPGTSFLAGGGTGATPAVVGGLVYAAFADGSVTALDLASGRPQWTQATGGGVISSPAVAGGVVYVGGNDGYVRGLDAGSGQPLWRYEIGPWVASSPAVSGNTVVVGAWDGNLYAFTPTGGPPVTRWSTVTGVVRGEDGAALPDARVVVRGPGGEIRADRRADGSGRYAVAVPTGSYLVQAARRGQLAGSTAVTVETDGGTVEADVALTPVTVPVAGTTDLPVDAAAASTRLDTQLGVPYSFVANDRLVAAVGTSVASNNNPGTFQPGWLSDITLSDGQGLENLDWSELMLTTAAPGAPDWGRSGEWLPLPDVTVEGDRVVASGASQVAPDVRARLTYRALPGAPVVKMTLELTNAGATDFQGNFQYLLDPDTASDVSIVPGVAARNPGYLSSGWTGNVVYDGATTASGVPAQGIAWLGDTPVTVSALGYVVGVWFDASVAAGGSRTITWYHITDYPAAGADVTANVVGWADRLAELDTEATVARTVPVAAE